MSLVLLTGAAGRIGTVLRGGLPERGWALRSLDVAPLPDERPGEEQVVADVTDLAAMAGHVLYDSVGWPDPVRGVVAMVGYALGCREERVVSDLAWRRLKGWRRLIAQVLDPSVAPGALEGITEVRVEHGPHSMSQSWLLIGWLAAHLGWAPEVGKVAVGRGVSG